MKTTTLILGIVISFLIGGSVGYFSGIYTHSDDGQDKKLEDSINMMKTQSLSIQKMAEMMKSNGLVMQEIGTDEAISKGKDMQMIGEKYMMENTKAMEDGHMKEMMN